MLVGFSCMEKKQYLFLILGVFKAWKELTVGSFVIYGRAIILGFFRKGGFTK